MSEEEEKSEVYYYKSRMRIDYDDTSERDEARQYQLELLLMKASDCTAIGVLMHDLISRMEQQGHKTEKFDLCLCMLDTSINTLVRYAHSDLRRLGFIK